MNWFQVATRVDWLWSPDTPLKRKWVSLGDQTKNAQFALDKGIPIVLRAFSVWSWQDFTVLTKKLQIKLDNMILLVINSEQKPFLFKKKSEY